MTDTRTFTGILVDPSGVILPDTEIVIRAKSVAGQYGKVKLPRNTRVRSGIDGSISLALMPGEYEGAVSLDGRLWVFPINPRETGPALFSEIIPGADVSITPQVLLDVWAARDVTLAVQAYVQSFGITNIDGGNARSVAVAGTVIDGGTA
jgi:hypothetical protein